MQLGANGMKLQTSRSSVTLEAEMQVAEITNGSDRLIKGLYLLGEDTEGFCKAGIILFSGQAVVTL